jgi:Uri superfamily endonuclease
MSNFEEAVHHGFSKEELAQEMAEKMTRVDELGCSGCRYKFRNYKSCETVIELADRFKGICPYFKKEERS